MLMILMRDLNLRNSLANFKKVLNKQDKHRQFTIKDENREIFKLSGHKNKK